jgi:hypothetical protein
MRPHTRIAVSTSSLMQAASGLHAGHRESRIRDACLLVERERSAKPSEHERAPRTEQMTVLVLGGESDRSVCRAVRDRSDSCSVVASPPTTGHWKYDFMPCGSGVLSSATIIDEI